MSRVFYRACSQWLTQPRGLSNWRLAWPVESSEGPSSGYFWQDSASFPSPAFARCEGRAHIDVVRPFVTEAPRGLSERHLYCLELPGTFCIQRSEQDWPAMPMADRRLAFVRDPQPHWHSAGANKACLQPMQPQYTTFDPLNLVDFIPPPFPR